MICPNCKQGNLQKANHPSHLECKSCLAIQLVYDPQTHQELFHVTPFRRNEDGSNRLQIIGIFGGYGSAKSTASVHEFFLRCLESPGSIGLVTAPTLPLLKKTTWKTLLDEVIPPQLIESINKQEMTIVLTNGFTIYGIPSDDEEKLRSINAGLVHMEEASGINRTIYDQMLARTRNPHCPCRAIFVCSNPSLGWIKDVIVNNVHRANPTHPEHADYNPDITCYIWETKLNKYLPPDFLENLIKGKPEWWVKRFTQGSFDYSDGMVYVNTASTIIEDDPELIKPNWEIVIGADFGLRNPTSVIFGAIDPDNGILYIYREYYVAGKTVPEHAQILLPILSQIPPGILRYMKGDPSMKNRATADGKSVMGLYNEYGIYFQPGNNQVEAGILKLNAYIELKRIRIFRSCVNLLKEMFNYKFPELSMDDEKNLDENPIKKDDHACDALRYLVMELPDDPNELKTKGSRPATAEDYRKIENQMYDDEYDLQRYYKDYNNFQNVGY